jgi:hypothetical protein
MTFVANIYISHIVVNWDKSLHVNIARRRRSNDCARFYVHGKSAQSSCTGIKRLHQLLLIATTINTISAKVPTERQELVDCCFTATRGRGTSTRFDSDSFQIAIDNCATSCFTNSMDDFVGTPTKVDTNITGIGKAKSTFVGTAKWLIVDDQGRKHKLLIPGTRFQKDLPFRLLSPQHVTQVYNDPQTSCLTLINKVIFEWGAGKWKRTLPLHKSSNVALMWSAPGNKKFFAFAAIYGPIHIIPNEDEEEEQASSEEESDDESIIGDKVQPHDQHDDDLPTTSTPQREQPVMIDFLPELDRRQVKEPPDITSKQAALRQCQERFNHMSFARIQSMAKQGLLPQFYADIEPPFCASCVYGKATRRPWRTKGEQGRTTKLVPICRSGDCVSVDQLESPTPGFVGQIKGWLTTKRYRAAVGRMNCRRAEERRQSRSVEKTKDVERNDLWRFIMNNDLISLSIDNRLY